MFRVAKVEVGDVVDQTPVRLLGNILVEAAIAGLHVEYGDAESLRHHGGEAAVRVPEYENCIGTLL